VIAPALAINVVAIPYSQGLAGANDVSYVPRLQKAARSVSATMSSAACAPSRRAAYRCGGSGHLRERSADNLRLTPDEPEPTSWTEIDTRLAELGARVSFAAAQIDEPQGHRRHDDQVAGQRRVSGCTRTTYVILRN
jgi:hypothetical protein